MKRFLSVVGLALVLVVAGWVARDQGLLVALLGRDNAAGENPAGTAGSASSRGSDASERGPVALGRVEPAGKVIDISAPPGDRVETLHVDENAEVRKNDPLVTLDSRALRELELQAVRSQIKEAEAQRASETRLADARINAAKAALAQAEAYATEVQVQATKIEVLKRNLELAVNAQRRLKTLQAGVVSVQEREQQDLAVQKAAAEVKAAEALLEKARRTGPLSVEAAKADLDAATAAKEQVQSANALDSLKKREELAAAQSDRSVLRAPCDGTVLKVFVRPGEAVAPTPILQIGDRRRMVVVAEVYETEVKRVRVGRKATIRSRAFPSPYDEKGLSGTVSRISKTIAPPEMQSLDPLAEKDRRVVEVRVDLDAQGSKAAAELIHLQVEVEFAPASP